MREIGKDEYLKDSFYMADSGDYKTGITSLTFSNSGDVQLKKIGGAFIDVSSEMAILERGFGWYDLVSSLTAHMDTSGKTIMHITETTSLSSIPAELVLDVTPIDMPATVNSLNIEMGSLTAQVSSLMALSSSMSNNVSSYAQYRADLTPLTSAIKAGAIVLPIQSINSGDPLDMHQKSTFEGTFYVAAAFSSYVASYDAYLSGKQEPRDTDFLFTQPGSVNNTSSMSVWFTVPVSSMGLEATDLAHFEVQFRSRSDQGAEVYPAITGQLRILETVKPGGA